MKIVTGAMGALGIVLAGTGLAAADGWPRGSIKDTPAVQPSCGSGYNWGGWFGGVQFGNAAIRSTLGVNQAAGATMSQDMSGMTVGGIVGYNWQKCNVVTGVEVDGAWTFPSRTWSSAGPFNASIGLPAGGGFNARSEMDFYGSVKFRTGLAFDQLLMYITTGFAVADMEHRGIFNAPGVTGGFNASNFRTGWIAGFGTELAVASRITLRTEATYTRLDTKDVPFRFVPSQTSPNLTLRASDDVWLVRTGINFKL